MTKRQSILLALLVASNFINYIDSGNMPEAMGRLPDAFFSCSA